MRPLCLLRGKGTGVKSSLLELQPAPLQPPFLQFYPRSLGSFFPQTSPNSRKTKMIKKLGAGAIGVLRCQFQSRTNGGD